MFQFWYGIFLFCFVITVGCIGFYAKKHNL